MITNDTESASQAQWGSAASTQGQAHCLGSAERCPASCFSSPGFILPRNPNFRGMLCSVLGSLCFYQKRGNCTLPWFPQMPKHVEVGCCLGNWLSCWLGVW